MSWLWLAAGLLVIAGVAVVLLPRSSIQVPDYVFALLGLDSEQDIGEWLSSALLAINGTIAMLIARPPFFERNLAGIGSG
ncbi:MAG: hypothetical protein LC739_14315 [Actinobacteria bacterium]|nr:hypothetical protein [Actinomycetota bacterium]